MLVYLFVDRLALLVTRARTMNGTAALNQLSHEGAVVQFHLCFDAPGHVRRIVTGVSFDSVSTTGNF